MLSLMEVAKGHRMLPTELTIFDFSKLRKPMDLSDQLFPPSLSGFDIAVKAKIDILFSSVII